MKTQADYDAEIARMKKEIDEAMRAITDADIRKSMRKPRPWWNEFVVGWVAGLMFCVFIDWITS